MKKIIKKVYVMLKKLHHHLEELARATSYATNR